MCLCDCVSIAALFDCLTRDLRCFAGYFTENKIQIYKGFVELDFCKWFGTLRIFDERRLSLSLINIKQGLVCHSGFKRLNNLQYTKRL
jgi:hypothetical protein